jgi:hypothetical protein
LVKNKKYGVVSIQNKLIDYDMLCSPSYNPNKRANEFYVQKNKHFFDINNKTRLLEIKFRYEKK